MEDTAKLSKTNFSIANLLANCQESDSRDPEEQSEGEEINYDHQLNCTKENIKIQVKLK